jgi:hypothetical protein
VVVVDGATNNFLGAVPVGTEPAGIAFDETNGNAFVTNQLSGTISILRPTIYPVPKYNVTFQETGLPVGTPWLVTFNSTWLSSTTGSIRFFAADGEYSYLVSNISGYAAFPLSGLVTVNDGNVNVTIHFSPILYPLVFQESGLPSGTEWTIVWNGTTKNATGSTLTLNAANGTYSYAIGSVNNYTVITQPPSPITVSGSGVSIQVTFVQLLTYFSANFTESGGVHGTCHPFTQVIQLTASVFGGTPPYNFTWGFGPTSPLAYGPVVNHTYTAWGQYSVTMWVTDANGRNSSHTGVASVYPPSGCPIQINPGGGGGLPVTWIAMGLVLVLVATGCVWLLRRRGRPSPIR